MLATVHIVLHQELKTSHTALITSLQTVREAWCWLSKERSVGRNAQLKEIVYLNKHNTYFININVLQPNNTVNFDNCILHCCLFFFLARVLGAYAIILLQLQPYQQYTVTFQVLQQKNIEPKRKCVKESEGGACLLSNFSTRWSSGLSAHHSFLSTSMAASLLPRVPFLHKHYTTSPSASFSK